MNLGKFLLTKFWINCASLQKQKVNVNNTENKLQLFNQGAVSVVTSQRWTHCHNSNKERIIAGRPTETKCLWWMALVAFSPEAIKHLTSTSQKLQFMMFKRIQRTIYKRFKPNIFITQLSKHILESKCKPICCIFLSLFLCHPPYIGPQWKRNNDRVYIRSIHQGAWWSEALKVWWAPAGTELSHPLSHTASWRGQTSNRNNLEKLFCWPPVNIIDWKEEGVEEVRTYRGSVDGDSRRMECSREGVKQCKQWGKEVKFKGYFSKVLWLTCSAA